jgi:UDP-N-acetylglucosamine transferase subunit ALG13
MMCSSLGKKPIVMPRHASLNEHVDDHQVLFAGRLAEAGTIDLADSEARLHELLSTTLAGGASGTGTRGRAHVDAAVRRFEELVGELVGGHGHTPAA